MRDTPVASGSSGSPYGGQSPPPDARLSVWSEDGNSLPPLPPPFERHCPPMAGEQTPDANISEEEAEMAAALTEYFQQQRWVHERVSGLCVKNCSTKSSKCRLHVRVNQVSR